MSRTAQGQTKTYVYDFDGNLAESYTADAYKLYMTYDAQNRMTSAQYADGSSVTHRNEYNYAGNSLLAELKKYDAGTLAGTTRYLRSGFLPMQERDAANTVAREYTWGQNLGGGIGGLLNLKQGGADYSYLYDGKGNVAALIDSFQNLVASYAYDPFGQLMSKSGTLDQPYMFSTKEYDPRTGLNYYGYRFYDSCSGKWTTRDPLGEAGGINLYQFVKNQPTRFIDPVGLYNFDVHYGVTLNTALNDVQMDARIALRIASADLDFDINLRSAPELPWGTPYHFKSLEEAEVGLLNALNRGDIDSFGEFLHMMQDSFSHAGYKPPLGHLFARKNPDEYNPNCGRDKKMKEKTIEWLNKFNKKWSGYTF